MVPANAIHPLIMISHGQRHFIEPPSQLLRFCKEVR